jgi:hypothetical protein
MTRLVKKGTPETSRAVTRPERRNRLAPGGRTVRHAAGGPASAGTRVDPAACGACAEPVADCIAGEQRGPLACVTGQHRRFARERRRFALDARGSLASKRAGAVEPSGPQLCLARHAAQRRGVDAARPWPAIDWQEQKQKLLLVLFCTPYGGFAFCGKDRRERPAVAGGARGWRGDQSALRRDHSKLKVLPSSVSTRLA